MPDPRIAIAKAVKRYSVTIEPPHDDAADRTFPTVEMAREYAETIHTDHCWPIVDLTDWTPGPGMFGRRP